MFKRSSYMGILALTLISIFALLPVYVRADYEIGMSIKEGFLQQTYVNQSVNITAMPLSGTPPYTYQWYTQLWTTMGGSPLGPITPFPNATSATFRFVEDTTGTYDISLQINDSAGNGDYDSFPIQGVWVIVKPQQSPTPLTRSLTPTPTLSNMTVSPNPTPAVPEFSWLTILSLLLTIPIALAIVRKKVQKNV